MHSFINVHNITIATTVDCPSTSTMVLNPTYVATVTPLTVNGELCMCNTEKVRQGQKFKDNDTSVLHSPDLWIQCLTHI